MPLGRGVLIVVYAIGAKGQGSNEMKFILVVLLANLLASISILITKHMTRTASTLELMFYGNLLLLPFLAVLTFPHRHIHLSPNHNFYWH